MRVMRGEGDEEWGVRVGVMSDEEWGVRVGVMSDEE